jgi:hypothetical protein
VRTAEQWHGSQGPGAHRRAAFVLRKLDSLRVLEEAGLAGPSYAMLKRRLPVYPSWLN